ncbi:MAG: phosphodiester glycosidase family protein, partial [Nitriliruptoraceae bacterium]
LEIRVSGGLARGNVITVPDGDSEVVVRPRIAQGTVAGTQAMGPMSRAQMHRGGIAGINGGYFLNGSTQQGPWGAPNGLHLDRGRLLAGQAVNSLTGGGEATGRGMVGWHDDGTTVMDRIAVTHELRFADGSPPLRIDQLNRQPWPEDEAERRPDGELLLYGDRFGTLVQVPAGSVVAVLGGLSLGSTGASQATITHMITTDEDDTFAVPDDQHLLVAHGARAQDLSAASLGDDVEVHTEIAPEATAASRWDDLDSGVAGGQLMVRDGQRRSAAEWTDLAAFGEDHALERQPRTAIGRTGDGRTLLVTIDGRRSGWSDGLTVGELADTMIALGARDAVNLDGGGSTTMTVEGEVRNRPSETGRGVADGIFVYVPRPGAARGLAEACPPEVLLTTFVDVGGHTHQEAIGCLAGWGVTTGVTETTFVPDVSVTRAQLASFLARWIDDVADRGSGTALFGDAELPFVDVHPDDVHAGPIARLTAAGVITGRTATTFEPNAAVTRAQTAALIGRTLEYVTGEGLPRGRDTFTDDNDTTHEPVIDRLAATGVVTGTGDWRFRPSASVTRGAVASFVMRAAAMLVEQDVVGVPDDPLITADEGGVDEVADPDEEPDEEDDTDDADGEPDEAETGAGVP